MWNALQHCPVDVPVDGAMLVGDLAWPEGARGVVLCAHGSGSSRHSVRNRKVAQVLQEAGFATLLFDLLTADEEEVDVQTRHLRFDIERLSERLVATIDRVGELERTRGTPVGLCSASTGSAAALVAASRRAEVVCGVVSRGGRPDLAGDALPEVRCPTLLIVGSDDPTVVELNRRAEARMRTTTDLHIVPGASQLFSEPSKLEAVAALTRDWFTRCVGRA